MNLQDSDKQQESEFLQEFVEEAKEHLENIEMKILEMERDINNKETINSIFRSIHTVKGLAGFVAQELIETISHKTENVLVLIRKGELQSSKKVVDLVLLSVDFIRTICNEIDIQENSEFLKEVEKHIEYMEKFRDSSPKIGDILKEKIGISEEEIEEMVEKQKSDYQGMKLGEIVVKENKATAKEVIEILRSQEEQEENIEPVQGTTNSGFVKVPIDKLESIGDMFGEIMTLHLQLMQENRVNENSSAKYVRMEKIIKDVQNNLNELRMVSFKNVFSKLTKIAKDTAKDLEINIEVETAGDECEIDRNISDKLFEPMMHIVKNGVYHGIYCEKKEERISNIKKETGSIKITARSNRGYVYIEIGDDGRGIDLNGILEKGISEGLLEQGKKYSEHEISELIFRPGFSTAKDINRISGRGFGLDVVKSEISKIGGKIDIESKAGWGTTFKIKIPINMAVINGTVVEINKKKYVIPTMHIKEIIKNEEKINISRQGKISMVKIRDKIIPLINKASVVGKDNVTESENIIIILENEDKQKAFKVDNVLERREILIKNISDTFIEQKQIMGGAILGDGKVALILDVESILNYEQHEELV